MKYPLLIRYWAVVPSRHLLVYATMVAQVSLSHSDIFHFKQSAANCSFIYAFVKLKQTNKIKYTVGDDLPNSLVIQKCTL